MVTVTHKVDRHLEVSLNMEDRPAPSLNLDPFINHEVMWATDPRVFGSLLGRWIYTKGTSVKSYFRKIGMLNNQTPQTLELRKWWESWIWESLLRTPLKCMIIQWRNTRMVLRGSPALGEKSSHKAQNIEGWSCEVMRTIDIGTLQDLP
jgi:hypothetical protein